MGVHLHRLARAKVLIQAAHRTKQQSKPRETGDLRDLPMHTQMVIMML